MTRKTNGQGRFSNRQKTWAWIIVTTAIVFGLLFKEQIAILYVLATLSVSVLLLIVAFANLGEAQVVPAQIATPNDALPLEATIASGQPATQSTFGARNKKRRH